MLLIALNGCWFTKLEEALTVYVTPEMLAGLAVSHCPLGGRVLPNEYPAFAVHLPAPASDHEFEGHAVHAAVPGVMYWLGPQQAPAPAGLPSPAAQSRHTAAKLAPVLAEYLPPAQSRQALGVVAPTVAEYSPTVQFAHTEAPAPVEYLPAPQSRQVPAETAPTAAEDLPAEQPVQATKALAPTVTE